MSHQVFSPPYLFIGLYAKESRQRLEAPNRATVAAIFERRRDEQKRRAWRAKVKQMHDSGIHFPGQCPFCPSNIYYD